MHVGYDYPVYRKIPIISPGLIIVQKVFCWAYFWGSLISEGLVIGGNFAFQNGLGLTITTVNSNSPWAYIREGLLLEGYLRLRFGGGGGGLSFRRAYFGEGLLSGILRYQSWLNTVVKSLYRGDSGKCELNLPLSIVVIAKFEEKSSPAKGVKDTFVSSKNVWPVKFEMKTCLPGRNK